MVFSEFLRNQSGSISWVNICYTTIFLLSTKTNREYICCSINFLKIMKYLFQLTNFLTSFWEKCHFQLPCSSYLLSFVGLIQIAKFLNLSLWRHLREQNVNKRRKTCFGNKYYIYKTELVGSYDLFDMHVVRLLIVFN